MQKSNLKAHNKILTLAIMVFLICTSNGLSAQNKNCITFGLRYNQTDMNNNLSNILLFSTNFYPLRNAQQSIRNNIGSEISYTRFVKLSKTFNLNAGAIFQEERCDFVATYIATGKRLFKNIGIHIALEKRIKLNHEVSLGFSAGLLINKSIKFPVGLTDRGSYTLTIGSTPNDTINSMEETESLYVKSANLKLTPRFEISAYFKSGKHLIKFSGFFQVEAKKYNYMAYNWGYKDYKHKDFYQAPTYYTDNFRMKIFGITMGYCF